LNFYIVIVPQTLLVDIGLKAEARDKPKKARK
jgi:hypothetical protein